MLDKLKARLWDLLVALAMWWMSRKQKKEDEKKKDEEAQKTEQEKIDENFNELDRGK